MRKLLRSIAVIFAVNLFFFAANTVANSKMVKKNELSETLSPKDCSKLRTQVKNKENVSKEDTSKLFLCLELENDPSRLYPYMRAFLPLTEPELPGAI